MTFEFNGIVFHAGTAPCGRSNVTVTVTPEAVAAAWNRLQAARQGVESSTPHPLLNQEVLDAKDDALFEFALNQATTEWADLLAASKVLATRESVASDCNCIRGERPHPKTASKAEAEAAGCRQLFLHK